MLKRMAVVLAALGTWHAAPVQAQTCIQYPPWSSAGERIFSPYGVDRSSRPGASRGYHQGLDIANAVGRGDPIYAGVSGKVVVAQGGSGGLKVVVETTDGAQRFGYFHLDAIHPSIRVGSTVAANTQIGTMGASGVSSGAVHIHLITLLSGATLQAAGGNSRVWSSPHGWTGAKSSPPMTAEAIRGAAPASFYFVNPETYLHQRIPFDPGTLAAQSYIDQGLIRPDGLSLAPTCAPSAEAFSAPAQSTGLGTSPDEIGSIMGSATSDIGYAVDMATGEARDAVLNLAKVQLEHLKLQEHVTTNYAAGLDQTWAGLILTEINE